MTKTLGKKEQSGESTIRRNAKTLGSRTYEPKVDLADLSIASQEKISEFIKSQKAYFENKASGVIKKKSRVHTEREVVRASYQDASRSNSASARRSLQRH